MGNRQVCVNPPWNGSAMSKSTDTEPGFSGAVRDLIRVARDASMLAEGRTSTLSERVSGGKPGSAHLSFGGDLPVVDRLEHSIRRLTEVYAAEVDGTGAERVRSQDKTSAARKAKTRAVLAEVGMDPTAVAFVYGMTTEGVRKARGRAGFDPDTGVRLSELRSERIDGKQTRPTPLTAPAGSWSRSVPREP